MLCAAIEAILAALFAALVVGGLFWLFRKPKIKIKSVSDAGWGYLWATDFESKKAHITHIGIRITVCLVNSWEHDIDISAQIKCKHGIAFLSFETYPVMKGGRIALTEDGRLIMTEAGIIPIEGMKKPKCQTKVIRLRLPIDQMQGKEGDTSEGLLQLHIRSGRRCYIFGKSSLERQIRIPFDPAKLSNPGV